MREEEQHVFRMAQIIVDSEMTRRKSERLPTLIEIAAQLCLRQPKDIADYYSIDDRFLQTKISERCVDLLDPERPRITPIRKGNDQTRP